MYILILFPVLVKILVYCYCKLAYSFCFSDSFVDKAIKRVSFTFWKYAKTNGIRLFSWGRQWLLTSASLLLDKLFCSTISNDVTFSQLIFSLVVCFDGHWNCLLVSTAMTIIDVLVMLVILKLVLQENAYEKVALLQCMGLANSFLLG